MSLWIVALTLVAATQETSEPSPMMKTWTQRQTPLRLYGNTYYVGTRGLSALLVTSPQGHVLVDAGLAQSAADVIANIEALGFKTSDVKLIVTSHAHSDHVGGIAELQRLTGAVVATSPIDAASLRRGRPGSDDPQIAFGDSFPAVPRVREVKDGEVIKVGALALTARYTPGHTPGAMTWTWQACEAERCLNVAYVDSLNPVASDDFNFVSNTSYPHIVADFEKSFASVERIPCDILVVPHPEAAELWERVQRRDSGDRTALIDTNACRNYVTSRRAALTTRLTKDRQAPR